MALSQPDSGFDKITMGPGIARNVLHHPRIASMAIAGQALAVWLNDEVLSHPKLPGSKLAVLKQHAKQIGRLGHRVKLVGDDILAWKIHPQSIAAGFDALSLSRELNHGTKPIVESAGSQSFDLSPVTPHYVTVVAVNFDICPDGNPRLPGTDPLPTIPDHVGPGVPVFLVDTGYFKDNAELRRRAVKTVQGEWLNPDANGGAGAYQASGPDFKELPGSTKLNRLAGHGTMAAGVIAAHSPRASITVVGHRHEVLPVPPTGAPQDPLDKQKLFTSELAVARSLVKHLQPVQLDDRAVLPVICCQFAFPTIDGHTPLAVWSALRSLEESGMVVVAAAGNEDTSARYWPAAHPEVVGVAATDRPDQKKAGFSNWATWTDCCARGTDVVSTYIRHNGPVEWGSGSVDFETWAKWNGTCFAAPKVAGLIAERYAALRDSSAQATPAQAWAAIRADAIGARPRVNGVAGGPPSTGGGQPQKLVHIV